jgi:hypothetical protein
MLAAWEWSVAPQPIAVSDQVRYVIVPFVSAIVAALGIILPLALVARNERIKIGLQRETDRKKAKEEREEEQQQLERKRSQERADQIASAVQATHRDALLLRELVKVLSLKETTQEDVTNQELATLRSARKRLFKGVYENPELFATLIPSELQSGRRLEKLMLLLGVLESRLRDFEENHRYNSVMMFGLDFLIRVVDPESLHLDTKEALQIIAESDEDARALYEELKELLLDAEHN